MRRRIMVIGPTGSGKTTLCHLIDDNPRPLRKTQDMIFGKYTIDVPGSYLDNPWMYQHLISAAQNNASQVLILVDATRGRETYAPGFAKVFTCPVTGVVTKCDRASEEDVQKCVGQLKRVGVEEPWFFISKDEKVGIEKLKKYLFSLTLDGGEHEIYH